MFSLHMDISAQVDDVDHTILARFDLRKVGAIPTFRSTHFGGGYKNNHCLLWAGGIFNPSGKQNKEQNSRPPSQSKPLIWENRCATLQYLHLHH